MRTVASVALAAVLGILPWHSALAEDCPPLTRVVSLVLVPGVDDRYEAVPVTIQGVPKLMLLDTGGAFTEITAEAVAELKLPHRRGPFQLFNVSGESSSEYATASFALGPLKADTFDFAIAPGSNPFGDDTSIAGILAPTLLRHYDVDLDFAHHTIGLMSQEHCDGKVIYWHPAVVAVVPMRVLDSGHIVVPVLLDGHSVMALIDTGASGTTLNLPQAEALGLKPGDAQTPRSGALQDRSGALTYHHTFQSLGFEGVAVTNAQVEIIPDLTHGLMRDAAAAPTGSHLPARNNKMEADAAMLIGMNILRHFHLYIAYKEEKLYVTAADGPVSTTPPVVMTH